MRKQRQHRHTVDRCVQHQQQYTHVWQHWGQVKVKLRGQTKVNMAEEYYDDANNNKST